MKLKKIFNSDYVLVNDSPIEIGDWYLSKDETPRQYLEGSKFNPNDCIECEKITHSTFPIERGIGNWRGLCFKKIVPISLSDALQIERNQNIF